MPLNQRKVGKLSINDTESDGDFSVWVQNKARGQSICLSEAFRSLALTNPINSSGLQEGIDRDRNLRHDLSCTCDSANSKLHTQLLRELIGWNGGRRSESLPLSHFKFLGRPQQRRNHYHLRGSVTHISSLLFILQYVYKIYSKLISRSQIE
jgi:hypothetical protein